MRRQTYSSSLKYHFLFKPRCDVLPELPKVVNDQQKQFHQWSTGWLHRRRLDFHEAVRFCHSQTPKFSQHLFPKQPKQKKPLFFFSPCLLKAVHVAYRNSQAKGRIGAAARSEPCLWPTPQLTATPDP